MGEEEEEKDEGGGRGLSRSRVVLSMDSCTRWLLPGAFWCAAVCAVVLRALLVMCRASIDVVVPALYMHMPDADADADADAANTSTRRAANRTTRRAQHTHRETERERQIQRQRARGAHGAGLSRTAAAGQCVMWTHRDESMRTDSETAELARSDRNGDGDASLLLGCRARGLVRLCVGYCVWWCVRRHA